MKIIGEAQLEYIYPDGHREPVGPPVQNHICWPIWRRFMLADPNNMPTRRDATTQNSGSSERWRILVTSKDIKPTVLNAWVNNEVNVAVDQDTPIWTDRATANDPDLVTLTATIPAPSVGSTRTIRVIGVYMNGGYYPSVSGASGSPLTILRLSTPCIQPDNVQIGVTYRLYLYPLVEVPGRRVTARVYEEIRSLIKRAAQATASTGFNYRGLMGSLSSTCFELDGLSPMTLVGSKVINDAGVNTNEITDGGITSYALAESSTKTQARTNAYTHPITLTVAQTPSLGVFAKHLWVGDGGIEDSGAGSPTKMVKGLLYQPVLPGVTDPRQNVYGQRNTPVGPLQDSTPANMATMTGSITLNVDNWVDPYFQKLFRIRFGTSGNLSTPATYRVEVFDFNAGFVGNRWMTRTAILPHTLTPGRQFRGIATDVIYEDDVKFGGTTVRTPDNNRYVATFSCIRTRPGITIYDILRGSKRVFNATSTPALPVTAVSDGECTKGYTFVGCANTGLWRINPALDTVEQIPMPVGVNSNKVYQICAKNDVDGTLWVLYDGGLCKLSNPAAAIGSLSWTVHNPTLGSPTFTYAGITDNNWDKVTSMVIDPDHAEDRFLFTCSVLAGGSTANSWRLGWVWWNSAVGTAFNPSSSGVPLSSFVWTQANLLQISDMVRCVEGRWISAVANGVNGGDANQYHFTYGSNALAAIYFNTNQSSGRMVPMKIGSSAGFATCAVNATNDYPSVFIKASQIASLANNTTLSNSQANCEFAFRTGATTYVADIAVQGDDCGMMARPLLYLAGSNMVFTYEFYLQAYGVTPFMLPPSHAKYATYESVFWKIYGWDGGAWVRNHPGYRDVHAGLQTLPDLDGLRISFTDGVSGTSFVANEFWTSSIGKGLLKDNGTTYNGKLSWSLDPTGDIVISGSVPLTPLGLCTDEPVTFSLATPDYYAGSVSNVAADNAAHRLYQNRGTVVAHPRSYSQGYLVADQLIPASTDFDLRFKWISFEGNSTDKAMGVATGTGTYTYGVHFRYNATTGNLEVYNNTTLVGSVIPNPSVEAECRIARVGSTVSAYYNGTLVGSVTSTAQFVVYSRNTTSTEESGWWDMKLTYTENRRVMRLGDSGAGTGSYSSKFMGLTCSGQVGDTKVYLGSGSPLLANLDYSTAGAAMVGAGTVRVASGAGWLIFHDSEPANTVSGFTVAHYVMDNY